MIGPAPCHVPVLSWRSRTVEIKAEEKWLPSVKLLATEGEGEREARAPGHQTVLPLPAPKVSSWSTGL